MTALTNTQDQAISSQTNPVLSQEALTRVSHYGETTAVDAGVTVVAQGEPMERFLVILDGELAVEQKHRDRTEHVLTHAPASSLVMCIHSRGGPVWSPAAC